MATHNDTLTLPKAIHPLLTVLPPLLPIILLPAVVTSEDLDSDSPGKYSLRCTLSTVDDLIIFREISVSKALISMYGEVTKRLTIAAERANAKPNL